MHAPIAMVRSKAEVPISVSGFGSKAIGRFGTDARRTIVAAAPIARRTANSRARAATLYEITAYSPIAARTSVRAAKSPINHLYRFSSPQRL